MNKLVLLLFILILTACSTQVVSTQGLSTQDIEGVWYRIKLSDMPYPVDCVFSWEERILPRFYDMIIDLTGERPMMGFGGLTTNNTITDINIKGNIVELTFYFWMGDFHATLVFHFNEDGTMWAEELRSPDPSFQPLGRDRIGRDRIYHRIVGPEF